MDYEKFNKLTLKMMESTNEQEKKAIKKELEEMLENWWATKDNN